MGKESSKESTVECDSTSDNFRTCCDVFSDFTFAITQAINPNTVVPVFEPVFENLSQERSKIGSALKNIPLFENLSASTITQAINPNLVVPLFENLSDQERSKIGSALKNIPLFENLSNDERSKIARVLKGRNFRKGVYVYTEGQKASSFYIIKEGKASVVRKDPETKETIILDELVEGDHFGESAILSKDGILCASVRANSSLVLWSLHKVALSKLFKPERFNVAFSTRDAVTEERRAAVTLSESEKLSILNTVEGGSC